MILKEKKCEIILEQIHHLSYLINMQVIIIHEGGVTSMEPFLKKFFPEVYLKMKRDTKVSNYCKFDSPLLTTFTSSLYVAGLVASFFASSVTGAFGRKPSILVAGASFLAGSALGGAAVNVFMLISGRILLGVGIGFANQVTYSNIINVLLRDCQSVSMHSNKSSCNQ